MPHPNSTTSWRSASALGAALLAAASIAGCGDSSTAASSTDGQSAPPLKATLSEAKTSPAGGAVRACDGVSITPGAPAKRIISLRNYVTETLVALGVGPSLVGQVNAGAYTPLPSLRRAYDAVPVLAEQSPSKEQILSARPDLIVSDGSWAFDGKTVPKQTQLVEDGVAPYVIPTACLDADKGTPSFDGVYTTLSDLGRLTGNQATATRLVDWGKARVRATAEALTGQAPTVYAGAFTNGEFYAYDHGAYSPILAAARVDNAVPAGTVPAGSTYAAISREQILRREPQALVITYMDDDNREVQEQQVRTKLASLQAVKNGRVVYVPDAFFAGGLQTLQRLPDVAFGARGLPVPATLASQQPPIAQ